MCMAIKQQGQPLCNTEREDIVTFTISKDNALRLAQIELVAADLQRPTIASVELAFNGDTLTATATDSYRLVVYTIKFETGGLPDDSMTVLVPAKEFCNAIKNTLKLAPPEHKKAGLALSPAVAPGQTVTVTGDWPLPSGVMIKDITSGSTFPNVAQLFGGQEIDGRYRYGHQQYHEVPEHTTLPAFSGEYLAALGSLLGSTQALKKGMTPWQVTVMDKVLNEPAKGNKVPWAFATRDKEHTIGITYLLMPINPNRRDG